MTQLSLRCIGRTLVWARESVLGWFLGGGDAWPLDRRFGWTRLELFLHKLLGASCGVLLRCAFSSGTSLLQRPYGLDGWLHRLSIRNPLYHWQGLNRCWTCWSSRPSWQPLGGTELDRVVRKECPWLAVTMTGRFTCWKIQWLCYAPYWDWPSAKLGCGLFHSI